MLQMGTWLVKAEGYDRKNRYISYCPGKYIETKTIKGKEYVVVSFTNRSEYPFFDQNKGKRNVIEFPIDICTIYRKPGPKEMKLRTFFARLFMSSEKFWEWQHDTWQKYN
jgi:hypothetical protein